MAWKKTPVTLPPDFEEELTDDELMAEAGPMIIYEVSSGVVAVSTTNASMPKKELLAALHDIADCIEEHGMPDGPMSIKKKIS
jgi:hypothetical protein